MKPSKSTFYVAIVLSLLVSQCLVSGQGVVYNRYSGSRGLSTVVPLLVGAGVGWLIGKYLACEHCHSCNEENDNTEADCTEEEGCELGTQPGVAPNRICRCDESVRSIWK